MRKNKEDKQEIKETQKENVFSRIGGKIEEFRSALRYNFPDAERIVKLKGGKEKQAMEKEKNYIDKNNFRLQIGKMQENGETIYRPMMLKFGLEYIANHVKLDENGNGKVIIQLWPDLAQCLAQDDKQILSFEEEKKKIEELIRKILGKKGECIEIQNVADNYPDVFEALRKGKKGIIPEQEPNLDDFEVPLKSPLQIIKYLAYHCQTDQELMNLFYNTKPDKYIGQDQRKQLKPGESDADYYSVVEVGIRLFEVINGITIQGGIGRQRVYDKIISLILFGKDRIGKYKDFKTLQPLTSGKYKSLKALHDWISKNYEDINMQQLYIELDEKSLTKLEIHGKKKEKYKSKIKKAGLISLLCTSLASTTGVVYNNIDNKKRIEQYEEKLKIYLDSHSDLSPFVLISDEKYPLDNLFHESNKLLARYDFSEFDYFDEHGNRGNRIEDEFWDAFYGVWKYSKDKAGTLESFLSAEDFLNYYKGKLILQYGIDISERPYEYLLKHDYDAIKNTLNYGNIITKNKSLLKDLKKNKGKKFYTYYINGNVSEYEDQLYCLEFVKILIDNEYKDFVIAAPADINRNPVGEFTLDNGLKCMQDLQKNYGFSELE